MDEVDEYLATRRAVVYRHYSNKEIKPFNTFQDQVNWFSEYAYRNSSSNDKRTKSEQYKPKLGFFESILTKVDFALTKESGTYHTRFESGELYAEINFYDGKKKGLWRWWHRNGKLRGVSLYDDVEIEKNVKNRISLRDGQNRVHYQGMSDEQVRSETYQTQGYGKPNNIEREWYDNGLLKEERRWYYGKILSKICWNKEGVELRSSSDFPKTLIDLELTWECGITATYVRGITYVDEGDGLVPVTGMVFKNFKTGQPKFEGLYKEGKRQGMHREWYKNGRLKSEESWKDGLRHGFDRYWRKDGSLYFEKTYYLGLNDGVHENFYRNGNKSRVSTYLDGMNHGKHQSFYKNGQIETEYTYLEDEMVDTSREWFKNGQLKRETLLPDGKRRYSEHTWDEQGNLVRTYPPEGRV